MAETPIGQGGPEGIELPKVEVDVNTPEDFEGGVDVTDDGQGGAILQSLEGMEVETEVYDHNANLADVLDEQTLGELSSDLIAQYEEDSNSRDEWEEGYVKGLDLLGIKYEERTQPFAGASGANKHTAVVVVLRLPYLASLASHVVAFFSAVFEKDVGTQSMSSANPSLPHGDIALRSTTSKACPG